MKIIIEDSGWHRVQTMEYGDHECLRRQIGFMDILLYHKKNGQCYIEFRIGATLMMKRNYKRYVNAWNYATNFINDIHKEL